MLPAASPSSGHAPRQAPDPQTIRLCVLATIGKSIQVLYAGRLEYLSASGFDVTVCCASSDDDEAIRARGVHLKTFPFARAITPWHDARAFVQLYRFLRKERFDIVEVSTPKAALIGAIAARAAGCRCVIQILHGLPYEGQRWPLGAILRAATAIPCRLAHVTIAVAPSVVEKISADGLTTGEKIRVLGAGSANGVNVTRFSPERLGLGAGVRAAHGIAPDAVVIGFVGRLTRDKGIDELAVAFRALHEQARGAVLLIVGPFEERDRPSPETLRLLATHPGVRHVGWQSEVLPYMAAMNIVVLPTHREGLGNVLLEAAALGLPTVTTNATGARDAIVAGRTGLQVPVGDTNALTEALITLVRNPSLRDEMGRAGRNWVCDSFNQENVWRRQAREYRALVSRTSRDTG
jgi:glycosyltransferase involved in cell wall biosynthesis